MCAISKIHFIGKAKLALGCQHVPVNKQSDASVIIYQLTRLSIPQDLESLREIFITIRQKIIVADKLKIIEIYCLKSTLIETCFINFWGFVCLTNKCILTS